MRLREWREREGLTQEFVAGELGVSQPILSLMERADNPRLPREKRVLVRLYRLSKGEVTPNDFFDLPDLDTPELALGDELAPAPLLEAVEQ